MNANNNLKNLKQYIKALGQPSVVDALRVWPPPTLTTLDDACAAGGCLNPDPLTGLQALMDAEHHTGVSLPDGMMVEMDAYADVVAVRLSRWGGMWLQLLLLLFINHDVI